MRSDTDADTVNHNVIGLITITQALVEHALTARRPKTRHVVGSSARWVNVLHRFLGDLTLDHILRLGAGRT